MGLAATSGGMLFRTIYLGLLFEHVQIWQNTRQRIGAISGANFERSWVHCPHGLMDIWAFLRAEFGLARFIDVDLLQFGSVSSRSITARMLIRQHTTRSLNIVERHELIG